jgi:hypothetical protein
MFPVRGEIARPFLEATDARPGELEGAQTPAFFLGHQLQSAPDNLGFGLPGRFLQFFESGPILLPKAGVDVGLHLNNVAQTTRGVLRHLSIASVVPG